MVDLLIFDRVNEINLKIHLLLTFRILMLIINKSKDYNIILKYYRGYKRMKMQKISLYLVMLLFLSGCAGSSGKIQSNQSLSSSYRNTMQIEEYNYYYSGRSGLPYAVIGIDKKFKFNDRVWHKINTLDDLFLEIDRLANSPEDYYKMTVADILDLKGDKIGVWFSYYNYAVITISLDNSIIDVLNPYEHYSSP